MASNKLSYGTFTGGIPYLRFGHGARTMLFFAGGPGNLVPTGLGASGFTRGMKAFGDDFTIYFVTRKSGLPGHYTTEDMARDYAELIRADFGGHVDVVMGVSYGGLIAQHFAADYPEMFDHLVIVMSAHKVSDAARQIDVRYAELINHHKDRDAMALRASAAFDGILRHLMSAVLWLFGKPLLGKIDDMFRRDVVIEAKAEAAHDSTESLKRITVPVLIVGGDNDFAFPLSTLREMTSLIEGAVLKIYAGGHTAAFLDRRFAPDVMAFTSQTSAAGRKRELAFAAHPERGLR
jgi:pimeloyl-ACP methyl ester carboxylesterase